MVQNVIKIIVGIIGMIVSGVLMFYFIKMEGKKQSREKVTENIIVDSMDENNQVSDSATNKDIASVESSVSNLDNDVKAQSLSFIKFAILIFIALLLWILFFSPVRRRILLYRVQRLPSQQGVIKMYKHFLRAFSVQGLEIKSGETPLKYAQRIDEVLGFKQFNFRTITDIFNKASYSDMPIDKEEIQLVITFYSTFPAKIKERTGWLRYFVCNNILGII